MVEDLAASYIALKLENEILQAQVQRLMEENAALQAQIPELQKSGAATENEPLQKPSEAQEPQQFPESPQPPAAGEPWGPPAITEHRVPPESKEFQGSPKFKVHWEPREIKEPREPSAIKESSEPPEIKESQELPEVNESWKPPVPLDPTAAWELQETAKAKKAHKSTGLQDLSAWKPPAAREPQEAQKPLEAPATQKPQASPVGYELPAVWKTRSPDTQGVPAVKKLQSSEPHDLANDEEPQKVSEYQAISSQLESLEHPVTQGPLEPWVPQEPLDPSDAKEFLELSAPEESLEGIIVVETGRAHSELEAAPFPLEYPLAFNGDSQKLPKPLGQLNDYMRIRGHLYLTEAALVSFVASRILGEAGRWFQLLVDSQSPLLEQFERFMRVLQDTFDNPGNLEVVKHHLRQLGQRESLVHRYAAHLHFIAQELNLDESTLCIQFQEEFANSVQNELSRTSSANNLSDVIIQCIGLEEKRSGKADSSSSGPSLSEDRNGPESPPAENQPVQATNNRPHLSEAERARRREGHLCLYCGHPGHFARDCPVKPHRAQQAGNMEARR
uniref:Retrotransposon Gag like 3 n=1 Tax=Nannospalax galili TaxID=1026970 RepID=A0A8C6QEJ7_NANGA